MKISQKLLLFVLQHFSNLFSWLFFLIKICIDTRSVKINILTCFHRQHFIIIYFFSQVHAFKEDLIKQSQKIDNDLLMKVYEEKQRILNFNWCCPHEGQNIADTIP